MSDEQKYTIQGLDEYIRQGEPQQRERSEAWKVAIGLQQVDRLQTSEYLLDTAKRHIEGDISIGEAKELIDSYYKSAAGRKEVEVQSAKLSDELPPKCKNCTLEEVAVLRIMHENPTATQKEIATAIGKSERTVKTITVALQEKLIVKRMNGKRNGYWEFIE